MRPAPDPVRFNRRCDHEQVTPPASEHRRNKRPRPAHRFRHSSAITVAGVLATIAGISVGSWQPYLLVLLVIPLAISVWSWRAGTDVDAEGLTVRAALGRRRLPWSRVVGLEVDARRHVEAVLDSGGRVVLTAVTPADLPRLVEAAGGQLVAASAPGA
jgi:hypothetical protein